MKAQLFTDILKHNPYHDENGRFTSASSTAGAPVAKPGIHPNVSAKQAVAFVASDCGVTEEEAEQMINAIDGYIEKGPHMRVWQAGGIQTELSTDEAKTMSEQVENYIDKATKWGEGTLYRGIAVDKQTFEQLISDADNGAYVDMKGTSSWTSDKSVAAEFADKPGSYSVTFETNGTQKGASIDFRNEWAVGEVLISRHALWECVDYSTNGNSATIYLEEVL